MTTAEFVAIKDWAAAAPLADLWAVLRAPLCGERGAVRLTYAKNELKRRRHLPEAA